MGEEKRRSSRPFLTSIIAVCVLLPVVFADEIPPDPITSADPCADYGCAHVCITDGDAPPRCICHDDFVLAADGKSCETNNLCLENNGGCAHICTYLTTLGVQCYCQLGYQLAEDMKDCHLVDTSTEAASQSVSQSVGIPGVSAVMDVCTDSVSNVKDLILTGGSLDTLLGAGSMNNGCLSIDSSGGSVDPSDGSLDSGGGCSVNNGGCAQLCHMDTQGVRCSCRHYYELAEDGKNCHLANATLSQACADFGCEQTCISDGVTPHSGTKPGHFETTIVHFPTSEGVSEVSGASKRVSAAEGASEASSPEQANE